MDAGAIRASSGLMMRRVAAAEDWSEVRAMRYRALCARQDIAERAEREYGDEFDHAFNSETFLLTHEGRAIASTRTTVASASRRWALPAGQGFAEAIDALGPEVTRVEASLTLVDPLVALDWKAVLFHLFKAHMLECSVESADWLLVAVRESQIGFYRRMFNMEILSGNEPYPGLATPRVLMGLEYPVQAPILAKRIPLLEVSVDDECEFAQTGCILFGKSRRGGGEASRAGIAR